MELKLDSLQNFPRKKKRKNNQLTNLIFFLLFYFSSLFLFFFFFFLSLSLINDTVSRIARRFFPQDVPQISDAWITRRRTEAKDRWHSVHVNTEYGSNALNGLNAWIYIGIGSRDHSNGDLLQLRRPWSRISFRNVTVNVVETTVYGTDYVPLSSIIRGCKRFAKF